MNEKCARCGRQVDIDSPDFTYGESMAEGFVCEGCITGAEQQAIDDDDMSLGEALADAGLGPHADLEVMGDDEYKMREEVAQVLYGQDSPGEES